MYYERTRNMNITARIAAGIRGLFTTENRIVTGEGLSTFPLSLPAESKPTPTARHACACAGPAPRRRARGGRDKKKNADGAGGGALAVRPPFYNVR